MGLTELRSWGIGHSLKFDRLTMFTMAKIRIGVTYLDQHLVENDYYSEKEKVVGEWHGKAAERMGIEGQSIAAGDQSFQRLRENLHPVTGQKLTPRTRRFARHHTSRRDKALIGQMALRRKKWGTVARRSRELPGDYATAGKSNLIL